MWCDGYRRGEVPRCAGHDGLARKHPTQHYDDLARKHPNQRHNDRDRAFPGPKNQFVAGKQYRRSSISRCSPYNMTITPLPKAMYETRSRVRP